MTKISDYDNWLSLWIADKESIISTMISNMVADLEAGYDYKGKSIIQQKSAIDQYAANYKAQLDKFRIMGEKEINRWCYFDMKKRGAID